VVRIESRSDTILRRVRARPVGTWRITAPWNTSGDLRAKVWLKIRVAQRHLVTGPAGRCRLVLGASMTWERRQMKDAPKWWRWAGSNRRPAAYEFY
jgi:hypothetical protein